MNDHLLSGPGSLNNLEDVLLQFREGKYAPVSDIEQIFHHVNYKAWSSGCSKISMTRSETKVIKDHIMYLKVFRKIDSLCIAN